MTALERPLAAPVSDARPLKIDIVVHGRFHGFALTRALLGLGHDVRVHTNYPKGVVAKFGVPSQNVHSLVAHGVATRVAGRLGPYDARPALEPLFHRAFGRWAARSVRRDADLVYGFSGIMEEYLSTPRGAPHQMRSIVRGSAHIREQAQLLEEEEKRVGVAIDRPSQWMIAREEREYALADTIFVLSTFAYESFIKWGVPAERLQINPLGVDTAQFRASKAVAEAREARILSGAPLRVLNVGTLSAQKGTLDFVHMASQLRSNFQFSFIGTVVKSEVEHVLATADNPITILDRVPEHELVGVYAHADLFVFPTIQDGFAAVVLQAAAAGLPILATPNCSAPDFVIEDETGWILPIRDADAFIRRLRWCEENRPAVARCAGAASRQDALSRDWTEMAAELVNYYHRHTAEGCARGS